MGGGHLQNGGLDWLLPHPRPHYFENAPILGLYFTQETWNGKFWKKQTKSKTLSKFITLRTFQILKTSQK
jgi:hypothetical protein